MGIKKNKISKQHFQSKKRNQLRRGGVGDLEFLFWFCPTLVACYFLRGSFLTVAWAPADRYLLTASLVGLLFFGWIAFTENRVLRVLVIIMLLTWLPGSILSKFGEQALMNWGGMVLLVSSIGPVFSSRKTMMFRDKGWNAAMWLVFAVGVGSVAWWILGLPKFGLGEFTGLCNHANTLGPMAAMAIVGALIRAIYQRNYYWWAVVVLSLISLLLSGSRASLLAAVIGVLVVCLMDWRRLLRYAPLVLISGVVLSLFGGGRLLTGDLTKTLIGKGVTADSRIDLWESRWKEFKANKTYGVGVGVGEGDGILLMGKERKTVHVEPGSSYLALLSMTGAIGFISFFCVLGCALWRIFAAKMWKRNLHMKELIAILFVLLVHTGFEGWMLAVGSPFCFLFWLLLGHMNDCNIKASFGRR